MDEQRLKEIEDRAAKATRGPWRCDDERIVETDHKGDYDDDVCEVMHYGRAGGTGQFIAHARTDIPDLLAALRAAEERAARADAAMKDAIATRDAKWAEAKEAKAALFAVEAERDRCRGIATELIDRIADLADDAPERLRGDLLATVGGAREALGG